MHRGTREKLKSVGISTAGKYAVQMRADIMKNMIILSVWKREILRICSELRAVIHRGRCTGCWIFRTDQETLQTRGTQENLM